MAAKKKTTRRGRSVTKRKRAAASDVEEARYADVLTDLVSLLDDARRRAARSVNAVMTATYWETGRRIVEEQGGEERAGYGDALIERLAIDLTRRFGRGFGRRNLADMRRFYLAWPILQTVSAKSADPSESPSFPLPWSAYVALLSVHDAKARAFYEAEAERGGWNVRQLRRQIGSQFYERTLLSKNKAASRLRCLVLVDLKLDKLTHADVGQMHVYCNYAAKHWTHDDENPPVGLILCARKDAALAEYALDGLPNKVLAAEYRTTLPEPEVLEAELERTRQWLEARRAGRE